MADRFFELSIQRIWTVKVTDDGMNMDAIFDQTVNEFLNVDLRTCVEIIEIEDDSNFYPDNDQWWDIEVPDPDA